jgi:hypothetical protein
MIVRPQLAPYIDSCERVLLDPAAFMGAANLHRTPGLHVTDIIADMMRTIGVDRRNSLFGEDQLTGFQIQGYLWEQAMAQTLRQRVIDTQGAAINVPDFMLLPEIAVALDGRAAYWITKGCVMPPGFPRGYVLMSPDGGAIDPLRLLEIKWTTTSVNSAPKREWFYQAPAYLKGLSLAFGEPVQDVEWHVEYPCGDYRGSGVIYERWGKRYSEQQIDDNFDRIVQHASDRAASAEDHPWREYLVA